MAIKAENLELLRETAKQKRSVYLASTSLDLVFQTQIASINEQNVTLVNTVPYKSIKDFTTSRSFSLQCQMVRFISESIDTDGVNIVFPLSALSAIDETRQSQRFPFEPEEHVVCEFLNPLDQVTVLRKTVMDMSAMGISFRTPVSELFQPGLFISELKISIDRVPYTNTSGRVIYQRRLIDLKGKSNAQVGIKFEPLQRT